MEDGGCASLSELRFMDFIHCKVGDKDRIHVYYAHGEDNSTFVRRCYWLLDKSLEQIVLVHYRETKEVSLATHSNSSLLTDQSTPLLVTEEFDSGIANTYSEGERSLGDVEIFQRLIM
ncbi:hypothetical protein E1A91_D09G030400v1 [Gossypium mustelinum]|uniref:CG-1 domain-containing protein n=1 Tax=Gossypium mustelinum TaxID=34275 RepID=A0A5D2TEW3_GOSMU|nr:hypothetical protein E1A91_D09G030400v1 [Gossypium mustelinum]TYI63620.1 hypothetical protein E1A91_D09G030400v1 [Gossypium mustelinum]TYI63632.1 hypothetical protein E1A91_D09G030400v1 [Gossypium mustelinum]